MEEPVLAADKDVLSICSRKPDDFIVALSSIFFNVREKVIVSCRLFLFTVLHQSF